MVQEKKHTVLVIEDNALNREILTDILQDKYSVLLAENGLQGLEMLREHCSEIDVVLLDIQMPVMNGYQVLEAVSKDVLLREIPIVVTTGSKDTGEELNCLQLGAKDFISKPYNPVLVTLRVGNIIHLRESTIANIQKTKFIQNMNHEVRTPMNAIMGFCQLLETNAVGDADRKKYLNYIISNSKMLLWMIDNMLCLSEFDNNMIHIYKSDVNINLVCRNALATTEFSYPDGVKVYYTTDVPDDFQITTDGNRVQMILVNFLTNACKNTSKGEIHLNCSVTEKVGLVCLSVTDTGSGVPPEKAEYIFERFTKLNAFKQGNGLGLSITRNIANAIGGTVFLDTKYTNGARFVLEIPLEFQE
ncbi:MAG: hybrid sensor histidine kinase/response regulator [Bacteroidales bacterium]|nr:hybrid sensor histidine kinase/response regulator [Bacteroidales bacterium]